MHTKIFWAIFSILCGIVQVNAVEVFSDLPIHEAFLTKVSDITPIEVISASPPEPLQENIPPQLSPDTQWIPGYWVWLQNRQDFAWVCGVWRRPPPEQQWVSSYWLPVEGGWVRIEGYWSKNGGRDYIPIPPPDSINEDTGAPPSPNSFWAPGYWEYDSVGRQYRWLSGSWQSFDPNWVLIPAHYKWVPEGYVFIPAYWDWSLDRRGTAYSCVAPIEIIEPIIILQRYIVYYPSYLYIYIYSWHFQPDFWVSCWCSPPWWAWEGWWFMPWHAHWELWWWYTHPGFPQPVWISPTVIAKLQPPSPKLIESVKRAGRPIFITDRGIPSSSQWIDTINNVEGRKGRLTPLLPIDRNSVLKIQKQVDKNLPKPETKLRPNARDRVQSLPRPDLPLNQAIKPTGKMRLPTIPQIRGRTTELPGKQTDGRIRTESFQPTPQFQEHGRPSINVKPRDLQIQQFPQESQFKPRTIRIPPTPGQGRPYWQDEAKPLPQGPNVYQGGQGARIYSTNPRMYQEYNQSFRGQSLSDPHFDQGRYQQGLDHPEESMKHMPEIRERVQERIIRNQAQFRQQQKKD